MRKKMSRLSIINNNSVAKFMDNNVGSIYQEIAQAIYDSINEDWERAYMLIERQEGMIAFGVGRYTDDSDFLKPFAVDDELNLDITLKIEELHAITTEGGNNRWNFLWFALLPSGAFEINFIWNQDEQAQLAFLAKTRAVARHERSAGLGRLQLTQAEQRSPALYDTLVRETLKLIPEEWVTAAVTLTEAGAGLIEHHAQYRSPTEDEDDALNITTSWAVLLAIEELRRLKLSGGHPDWKEVTFTIEAAGTYRATFITKPASENKAAEGYSYDGTWQAPPA
jgi:hypothetical protein